MITKHSAIVLGAAALATLAACAGRPSLIPNADPAMRRTSAQFAADAATRHPYKIDEPRAGEAVARAEVDYTIKQIDIVNASDEDWTNVEVWINQNYVCFIPVMPRQKLKSLNFQMLFDGQGNSFPTAIGEAKIDKIELTHDGKVYDVPVHLVD